ncbi:MAG: hypothetical protein ABUS79_25635 [Pseudomonadota bacterium]
MRARMVGLLGLTLLGGGCVGNTGGDTFTFPVAAAGPADALAGQPFLFTSGGFTVTLTAATLHVGAVYLNQSAPTSGAQATGCYFTGTYVGQETSALDVDLLNPTPQLFPAPALGVTEPPVKAEQVWLTGGDVNSLGDTTTILAIAGSATGTPGTFPFTAQITIDANHAPTGTSTGGGDAICKQRIVSPIRQPITLERTGGLLLRIDPRAFFIGVDFSELPPDVANGGYVFGDDPAAPGYSPTGQYLYDNLRSLGAYQFSWVQDL